eukprot:scaffold2248_cov133-Isochrysis_galbana.AAC.13
MYLGRARRADASGASVVHGYRARSGPNPLHALETCLALARCETDPWERLLRRQGEREGARTKGSAEAWGVGGEANSGGVWGEMCGGGARVCREEGCCVRGAKRGGVHMETSWAVSMKKRDTTPSHVPKPSL